MCFSKENYNQFELHRIRKTFYSLLYKWDSCSIKAKNLHLFTELGEVWLFCCPVHFANDLCLPKNVCTIWCKIISNQTSRYSNSICSKCKYKTVESQVLCLKAENISLFLMTGTIPIHNALTTKHVSTTGFPRCYHGFWLLILDNNAILSSIHFDMLCITILTRFY